MNTLEVCGGVDSRPKNPGINKQCFDKGMISYWVTTDEFRFATLADVKSAAVKDTAIQSKSVVPLYGIDAIEAANVDSEKKQGLTSNPVIKEAVKGYKITHYLGLFSHSVMKSFEGSSYNRMIQVLEDGSLRLTQFGDGTYGGMKMSDFDVDIRLDPIIGANTGETVVNLQFEDNNEFEDRYAIIKPDYNAKSIKGIFDVILTADAVGSNTVSVQVTTGSGDFVKTLTMTDFVLKDAGGGAKALTSVTYNTATDKYDFAGASIIATDTIEINGVVKSSINFYESVEPVTLA